VNEKDLQEAIKEGKVSGAALDVFEKEPAIGNPLVELDEVICTPHLGASTGEAQENVAVAIVQQVVDFLLLGEVRNAVNIPSVSPDVLPLLRPFIQLGEKLGSFLGQMAVRAIEEVVIDYHGEVAIFGIKPITNSVLRGLLSLHLGETVNFVNAPLIARERRIRVIESIHTQAEDFTSLVSITVRSEHEVNSIAGTLFGRKELRIVRLNDFLIEAIPEGDILFIENYDCPGVVGSLGTALGGKNVNIATMELGRDRKGGKAISLIHLDNPLPPGALGDILRIPHIIAVREIHLE
jgi:D-3-phosphoglycerate dehydrogenase